jgi:hypothetical protein
VFSQTRNPLPVTLTKVPQLSTAVPTLPEGKWLAAIILQTVAPHRLRISLSRNLLTLKNRKLSFDIT